MNIQQTHSVTGDILSVILISGIVFWDLQQNKAVRMVL